MYKFYTISNEQTLEYLIGAKPSIKFSSAFGLNDPNELKFNCVANLESPELEVRYLADNPGKGKAEFKAWQSSLNSNHLWWISQNQRHDLSMTITLSCFTSSYGNNLMWSHYTNNHTGICVEYSTKLYSYLRNIQGFFAINVVSYTDDPPEFDLADYRSDDTIWKMIFNKQKEWQYEKESRIVRISDQDEEYLEFPRNLIKSVIIGSKANHSAVAQVISLCKDTEIQVYYAVNLGTTYKVSLEKHKEGTFYQRTFWT